MIYSKHRRKSYEHIYCTTFFFFASNSFSEMHDFFDLEISTYIMLMLIFPSLLELCAFLLYSTYIF
jgi:hypothetical protein